MLKNLRPWMGLGEAAMAAMPTGICPKPLFSDSLGGGGVISCTSEATLGHVDNSENNNGEGAVSFAIGETKSGLYTKAVGDPVTATDEEKTVKSLYAVLFCDADENASAKETGGEAGGDTFFKMIDVLALKDGGTYVEDTDTEIGGETVQTTDTYTLAVSTGDYQITFVANPSATLLASLNALKPGVSTVSDFKNTVCSQSPDSKYNASSATTNPGLLMTTLFYGAKVESEKTTELANSTNGVVYLERAMARIDIVNKASGVTVIDVTFNNRAVKTALVTDNPADAFNADYMEASKTYSLNLVGNSTAEDDDGSNKCKAKIYSYEQYGTDDNAPSLTISYTMGDDTSVRTRTVKFEETSIENSETVTHPINLVRNHLYTVNITNTAGRVRFNLTVADWNEGDTFEVTSNDLAYWLSEPDYSNLSVGQVMLSNGVLVPASDMTPFLGTKAIGVVAYVYPTDDTRTVSDAMKNALPEGTDKPHGLVLALKYAGKGTKWSTSSTTANANTVRASLKVAYNDDLDGYHRTKEVLTSTTLSLSVFTAFNAVKSYRENNAVPENVTDWYLPSMREWIDIMSKDGIGGVDISTIISTGTSGTEISITDPTTRTVCDNFNAFMEKVGSGNYDAFNVDSSCLWSSTEYNSSDAYAVFLYASNSILFGHGKKNYGDSARRVRCVLAF